MLSSLHERYEAKCPPKLVIRKLHIYDIASLQLVTKIDKKGTLTSYILASRERLLLAMSNLLRSCFILNFGRAKLSLNFAPTGSNISIMPLQCHRWRKFTVPDFYWTKLSTRGAHKCNMWNAVLLRSVLSFQTTTMLLNVWKFFFWLN